MDPVFAWIEESAFSDWLRSSSSLFAFPGVLVLHAWGMGFLAGTGAMLSLRALGAARQIPYAALTRFFPIVWIALAVNGVSGVLLLIAYPTKALTNPLFYAKLILIAAALTMTVRLRDCAPPSGEAKRLAVLTLVLWTAAIFAGRFLAYTHTRLLVDTPAYF